MTDVSALTDLPSPVVNDYFLTWRGSAPYRLNMSKVVYQDQTNGFFGIGVTSAIAKAKVHIKGPSVTGPTLGTPSGSLLIEGASAIGFEIGYATDGHTWLQAHNTNGTAAFRSITINEAGGLIGLGIAVPIYDIHAKGYNFVEAPTSALQGILTQSLASGNFITSVSDATAAKQYIVNSTTDVANSAVTGGAVGITFRILGVNKLLIDAAGHTKPGADNISTIGTATLRWSTVYAVTGTINTSDERHKAWRGELSEAELKASRLIIRELGFYQWQDAVEAKGDNARLHFGVRAQRAFKILDECGLDWRQYAWCCYDAWQDEYELGDDGERVLIMAAGDRYGVRPDQLALFLIAGQEQRLAALENRYSDGK